MIKDVLQGITAYFKSFGVIAKLKLWKYFAIPMVISFLIAILIFGSAYGLSDNIGDYLFQFWKWEFGSKFVYKVLNVFGGLLIFVIGLILYKHIIMAMSAPFMSPVSEKIEAYVLQKTKEEIALNHESFNTLLARGVKINVRNLFKELVLTIPILLTGIIIPVFGVISTILIFLLQAYYAGFGNMDYTLERHFNYKQSITFVRKHRGLAIGNGIVFMLFLLIPIIGFILVLPLSVTAASLKTVEAINKPIKFPNP